MNTAARLLLSLLPLLLVLLAAHVAVATTEPECNSVHNGVQYITSPFGPTKRCDHHGYTDGGTDVDCVSLETSACNTICSGINSGPLSGPVMAAYCPSSEAFCTEYVCDFYQNAQDENYVECGVCTPEHYCGDGHVDADDGEQCDPGAMCVAQAPWSSSLQWLHPEDRCSYTDSECPMYTIANGTQQQQVQGVCAVVAYDGCTADCQFLSSSSTSSATPTHTPTTSHTVGASSSVSPSRALFVGDRSSCATRTAAAAATPAGALAVAAVVALGAFAHA